MVKILSLNLCNYHNFEERKLRLVSFINDLQPNIVLLQEVRTNLKFNIGGVDQAHYLNQYLKYPFSSFIQTMDVNKLKGLENEPKCIEGLAALSKFRIVNVVKKELKKQAEDKFTRAIMYLKILADSPMDIFNVHFSPGNGFSELHLKETIQFAEENKIEPIIIGDFNIPDPSIISSIAKGYTISTEIIEYISYSPKNKIKRDKVYNTKPCTLDYILIPKKYTFKNFECVDKGLSDHSALFAEIVPR